MVGKHNKQLIQRRMAKQVTQWSIRRLNIGVASVAIASAFLLSGGISAVAKADTIDHEGMAATTVEAIDTAEDTIGNDVTAIDEKTEDDQVTAETDVTAGDQSAPEKEQADAKKEAKDEKDDQVVKAEEKDAKSEKTTKNVATAPAEKDTKAEEAVVKEEPTLKMTRTTPAAAEKVVAETATTDMTVADEKMLDLRVDLKDQAQPTTTLAAPTMSNDLKATVEDQKIALENAYVNREFEIKDGHLHTTSLENKLSHDVLDLSNSKEFTIHFKTDQGVTLPLSSDRNQWTVTSSSEANTTNEGPIRFALDGDMNTIYHSNYGNGTGTVNQMPVSVEFHFPKAKDIKSFVYVPRQNGDNGNIKEYKFYAKGANATYQEVKHGSLASVSGDPIFIDLGNLTGITDLKLEVLSSQNGQPLASAAEFDVSDKSTTELKKIIDDQLSANAISISDLTLQANGIKHTTTGDVDQYVFTFNPVEYHGQPVNIQYVVELGKEDKFTTSYLELSSSEAGRDQLVIDSIDLQNFQLNNVHSLHDFSHQKPIKEMAGYDGFYAGLGQPVYVDSFYTGSEFPVALNTVSGNDVLYSRYYVGKTLNQMGVDASGKYQTWRTVFGAARSDDYRVIQQDFYDYIAKIGQKTYFRKQFNSWFDHMKDITSDNIQESFNEIDRGFDLGGTRPLDAYVVDDGWQDMTTLWDFNDKFPNKFYSAYKQVGRFDGNFGVWLGPQGGYSEPGKLADNLVNQNLGSKYNGVVYVGDKRYTDGLAKVFADYEKKFDINYWKLDGLLLSPRPDTDPNGNFIGGGYKNMYSMTETFERWINLFKVIRENSSDPDNMWINLTSYIPPSPWFMQWVNSIWMQNSGDVDYMDGVKEDAYKNLDFGNDANEAITYRDNSYQALANDRQWQLPFANIYNHDPVYGEKANSGKHEYPGGPGRDKINFSTEDFRNYLYMLGTRGNGFWEFYYSPSMMDDDKWLVNGEAVNWMEDNYEVLKHSQFHGGVPGHGEVYGYSAWDGNKGIVSVRNPINKEQTYKLKLDRLVGVPEGIKGLYRKTILGDGTHNTTELTKYGDTLVLTLKPYETLVFEYSTEADTTPAQVQTTQTPGNNKIVLAFDETINIDKATFTVANHTVKNVTLAADLRTVTIELNDTLDDHDEVTVDYANVLDLAGQPNQANGSVDLKAYTDNVIEDISAVKPGQTLQQDGVEGTGEFSVTVKASLDKYGQTLAEQDGQWKLYVDDKGEVFFQVKDDKVGSMVYTQLKADDKDLPDTKLPLGETVVITASRMKNGSLKLYINGELRDTFYNNKQQNLPLDLTNVTVGTKDFAGKIDRFILANGDTDYVEAMNWVHTVSPQDTWENVPIKGTTATSFDPNDNGARPAGDATDGNVDTYWASDPTKNNAQDPQYLVVELPEKQTVGHIIYTPRQASATAVGNVKKAKIQYSLDGKTWQDVQFTNGTDVFTFPETTDSTNIGFNPVEAKFFRLQALETHHWSQDKENSVVAVAEFTPIVEKKADLTPKVTVSYLRNALEKFATLLKERPTFSSSQVVISALEQAVLALEAKDQKTVDDAFDMIDQINETFQTAPQGQDITVMVGDKAPEAIEGVKNAKDIVEGTTYEWQKPIDTANAGDQQGVIVITYKDDSTETITVTVHVMGKQTQADKYTPVGSPKEMMQGDNAPLPESMIGNATDLPQDVTYAWKQAPDMNAVGAQTVTIEVSYGDGTKDEVIATLTIKAKATQSEADKYTPVGTPKEMMQGDAAPLPESMIGNVTDLPQDVTYAWKQAPDMNAVGAQTVTIEVSYGDGTKDEVTATLTIKAKATQSEADKYTPVGSAKEMTQGDAAPLPESMIGNVTDLPQDVTYAWKQAPDMNTVGAQTVTIEVSYGDGTKDEVTATLTIKAKATQSEADKYTPTGKDRTFNLGDKAPEAASMVGNIISLPEDATYAWKQAPVMDKVGDQALTIVVTYADGSSDEVAVTLTIQDNRTDADKYTPTGKDRTFNLGDKAPEVESMVGNIISLPEDATYAWKQAPVMDKVGDQALTIVVTYADGSSDEVVVILTIQDNRTDADKYTPTGKDRTFNLGDKAPEVESMIGNIISLPEDATYAWKQAPVMDKVGNQALTIVVTYADGSSDEVAVTLTIQDNRTEADKYTPTGKDRTLPLGAKAPEVESMVGNIISLPEDATYAWKQAPVMDKVGDQALTIVVTYADGSSDEVAVTLTIQDDRTDADKYTPTGKDRTFNLGDKAPEVESMVGNIISLPQDATYAWKQAPVMDKVGDQALTIVVTYADGSSDEVAVTLTIQDNRTDADKYTPTGKDRTFNLGDKAPEVESMIGNIISLPKDATYAWKQAPVMDKVGDQALTIVVTYADGSSDEVAVTLTIQDDRQDNEKYTAMGQDVTVHQGETPDAMSAIMNKADLPEDTKVAWKTPVNTLLVGEVKGEVVVTYPDGSMTTLTVTVHVLSGETPTDPDDKPIDPSQKPDQPSQKPDQPDNKPGQKPDNSETVDQPHHADATDKADHTSAVKDPQAAAKASAERLPQTGATSSMSLLAGVLTVAGGFGLAKTKRRKQN
ncbi:MAG: Rib/alpha-like domain-containing protein [Aerococcus sp.]|nr:Rib/alpha-like domain-containing protein [Aerococcus sp.]